MSIQPRDLKSGRVTYYITFTGPNGVTVWERSGSSKRAAESLEAQRKREVASGTYSPTAPSGSRLTVSGWFNYFWTVRKNRSVENDMALIDNHVLDREWFANYRMTEVEPRTVLQLVEQLEAVPSIGAKTVSIIYGIIRQAFERAVFERVIDANPVKLPKGRIRWKSRNKRRPYTREEARRLTTDERLPWDARVFNGIAFYTGQREGEVCGRRWRHWKRDFQPLTALEISSQYDDQPLKTDSGDDVHPRLAPVHPELEVILSSWWSEGFEFTYGKKPTLDDFIVPHRKLGGHSKSSAYHAWRRSLDRLGIENKSLHATRNTFISIARSNGAPKDIVESVTHNARGDVIDDYTSFEWLALCRAVALFDVSVDRKTIAAFSELQSLDSNRGEQAGRSWKRSDITGKGSLENDGESPLALSWEALFDARQRGLLKLAEVNAHAAGVPEAIAVCKGLARVRAGDVAGAVEELRKEAARVG